MEKALRLHSADSGVDRIRIYPDNMESYFEYDSHKEELNLQAIFEDSEIFEWSSKAVEILKKSKTKMAMELVEEFDEIFGNLVDDIEEIQQKKKLKKYRVIKMHGGTFYTVQDTLDEIDSMIEEYNYNEKYGIH
jgi:uncharacterized linocin/CFP29 family protein